MGALEQALEAVVVRRIDGCRGLVSAERLSGGASQETHRLVVRTERGERKLAMRRAPGDAAPMLGQVGLEAEALLMREARSAGVPEPEVLYVLEEGDGLGRGFIMEWIEGEALGAKIVRDPAFDGVRPRLAEQCGEILARIHAIDLGKTGLGARLSHVTPETFVHLTWERYKALQLPQPMIDFVARWLLEHLPAEAEPALVHNDFRNGNLMMSPETGVVAVLDWEIAHVGDPMRDLGWICTNSWRFGRTDLPVGGFGSYADLFRGYERVSGKKVDVERVKFWEVFGSFWWAVGCLTMADLYRSGPDKTVERPAIGRRTSECQVDCVNLLIPGPVAVQRDAGTPDADTSRLEELLGSVRDYLRADVMPVTQGRTQFLARVAGNSIDIALRELAAGPQARARQRERLRVLLGEEGDLDALRRSLVRRLRENRIALGHPGLAEYLRESVVHQVAIDQPAYSGLKTALANSR